MYAELNEVENAIDGVMADSALNYYEARQFLIDVIRYAQDKLVGVESVIENIEGKDESEVQS